MPPRPIGHGRATVRAALLVAAAAFAATPAPAVTQDVDPDLYSAMQWREIGPFRGGRSVAATGVVQDPQTYYMGTVGGGVWKTTDAGLTWRNVSDGQLGTSSVGAIAVAESDPNVVYVGMGEHAVRGVMTSHGDGVYRSTDAGRTWTHLGLDRTRAISRVRVHPTNPDLVYVAAQGAPYGANEERGIYRSGDGGQSWEKILYVDENTGASDLSMDMTNPRILYASFWDHRRLPWQVVSGGPGSGFWKSTDGGDSWEPIDRGLPDAMGKTAIDVSRANPDRVFAMVEADPGGGLFRSDDAGRSWTLVSESWTIRARAWYYIEVYADPVDDETVYVMNAPFMKSIDGGRTFSSIRVPHGDQHDLWINPRDNEVMINANDGGANVSFNGGASWSTQQNQPTAQFYRVNLDNRYPYHVYGGQQDNSSVAIASRSFDGGIDWKDWYSVGGCESARPDFDADDPRFVYAGCYMGIISEYDHRTGSTRDVAAYPVMPAALQGREMKYRYNWSAPIIVSDHDPNVIYHASNIVVRSRDRGRTWEEISPDLSRDEDAKQGYGGGPITNEGAGGEIYGTIYGFDESPHDASVLWAGSDDGLVHVTRDGGATWLNVTGDWGEAIVNAVHVSPHDPATAYIAVTRYKFNDFTPMAFVTRDWGASWQSIATGFGDEAWVHVVREDPVRPGLLYAGTETGVYVSFDSGRRWQPLQNNLPNTPINDLMVHPREHDLVVATSGRSFWILDELQPLRQATDVAEGEPHLFAPGHTSRWAGGGGFGGGGGSAGQNPPNGAVIDFVLASAPDSAETVSVEILTADGRLVRTYSTRPDEDLSPGAQPMSVSAGANRVVWNLRHESIPNIPGAYVFGSLQGRRVVPGDYRVRLTVGEWSVTQPLEVRMDPRADATMADYVAQDRFVAEVAAELTAIHRAVTMNEDVRGQIEGLVERLDAHDGTEGLISEGEVLAGDLETVADSLFQRRTVDGQTVINFPTRLTFQYVFLHGNADADEPGVSMGSRDVLSDLRARWSVHQATNDELLGPRLDAFNAMVRDAGFSVIIVPPRPRRPIS